MGHPLLSGDAGAANWTGLETFHAKLTFGSSALSTVQTRGITSIVRNSAGKYTVTLPRVYRLLVEVRWMAIDAAGGVLLPVVDTDSVDSDGTLVFELRTEAGTATDPDDTTEGLLAIVVSNETFNDATI